MVPSLYVRVYRAIYWQRTQDASSLTIREGISSHNGSQILWRTFPHYTWGDIVECVQVWTTWRVPSLYVRVYRNWAQMKGYLFRSLTIREGISPKRPPKPGHLKFPHYTWGYISVYTVRLINDGVPSLYVRVYLSLHCTAHKRWSSLTIREGISVCLLFLVPCPVFPHYTWGYIVRSRYDAGLFQVPSLYVRVYRREKSWM